MNDGMVVLWLLDGLVPINHFDNIYNARLWLYVVDFVVGMVRDCG